MLHITGYTWCGTLQDTRGVVHCRIHVVWYITGYTWCGTLQDTRGVVHCRIHVVWYIAGYTWCGTVLGREIVCDE